MDLTDVGHLGDPGHVQVLGEARLVVVDVVDLDDELRLALQHLVGEAVDGLGVEDVVGLLLPVQPLGGVDVAGLLVYLEQSPRPVPRQHVLDAAVAPVGVRVKLQRQKQELLTLCGALTSFYRQLPKLERAAVNENFHICLIFSLEASASR